MTTTEFQQSDFLIYSYAFVQDCVYPQFMFIYVNFTYGIVLSYNSGLSAME